MRGGGGVRKIGNAAEAYVANLLRKEYPEGCTILPLQQDVPADLVALFLGGDWCLLQRSSAGKRVAGPFPLVCRQRNRQPLICCTRVTTTW